jgi:hypothetical protein
MSEYTTVFAAIDACAKGGMSVIADNPNSDLLSKMFEVARPEGARRLLDPPARRKMGRHLATASGEPRCAT